MNSYTVNHTRLTHFLILTLTAMVLAAGMFLTSGNALAQEEETSAPPDETTEPAPPTPDDDDEGEEEEPDCE